MSWKQDAWDVHCLFGHNIHGGNPGNHEDRCFLTMSCEGEAGELANLVKKIWRDHPAADRSIAWARSHHKIVEEMCDTYVYLTLLAICLEVDLDKEVELRLRAKREQWISEGRMPAGDVPKTDMPITRPPVDHRMLLLKLIASLTLCDHFGDISETIDTALNRMGEPIEYDDLSHLGKKLAKMGITTLYNTKLGSD